MATKKKLSKKPCKCANKRINRYYPAYITVNGRPAVPTRRALKDILHEFHEYKYTPYVTINYGKPPGCIPGHCQ